MDKCILCGKCVRICAEVQGVHAIGYIDRGFDTKIGTLFDGNWPIHLVSCGQCIYMCPVGALTAKPSHGLGWDYELKNTHYLSVLCVGCQLALNVKNDKIVGVSNIADSHNQGYLCVKGRLAMNLFTDRLTTPLIKKNGQFEEATWDEALDLVAENWGYQV